MENVVQISLFDLEPYKERDVGDLTSIIATIRQHGIIEPLIVRPHKTKKGKYQVVCGYRRFEAAKRVPEVSTVPCIIKDVDDREATYMWIVENLDRKELNPIEEGRIYDELTTRFGESQQAIAERIGKSQAYVSLRIQLLNLPPKVKELLKQGKLAVSYCEELLKVRDPEKQIQIAERISRENMSIGQLKKEISNLDRTDAEDLVDRIIDDILESSKQPSMNLAKCPVQPYFENIWKVRQSMKYRGVCDNCRHKDLCRKVAREADKAISTSMLKVEEVKNVYQETV
jgi:ParB/RepB/Spo0J family partition protein